MATIHFEDSGRNRIGCRFAYDAAGNRVATVFPNGLQEKVEYDGAGRVDRIRVREQANTSTVLLDRDYDYRLSDGSDTALRQSVTDEDGDTTTYAYGDGNRLVGASTVGGAEYDFAYDGAYNLTSRTVDGSTTSFSVNDANQVTAAGSTTYSYDDAGNLTGDSTGRAFTYNAANQVATMRASGGSAPVDVEYAGDGNFERVGYGSVEFADGLLGTSTRSGGGVDQSFVRDADGGLVAIVDGTDLRYVHRDGLGSVSLVSTPSGGVAQRYRYAPYGGVTETRNAAAIDNPFRFTGAYHDADQGVYKMGIRYQDPQLGRWTQPDPALSQARLAGANPYAYVRANPINLTDPTGAASAGCALGYVAWGIDFTVFVGTWASYAVPVAAVGVGAGWRPIRGVNGRRA